MQDVYKWKKVGKYDPEKENSKEKKKKPKISKNTAYSGSK